MSKIKVTWVRSGIGYARDQRATLITMGFHRLGETIELEESTMLRGMIHKVKHLVDVKVVNNEAE